MSFASFGLHPALQRGLDSLGFTRPTPIQEQAIPPGMEGRDIIASAKTGSGKTAAFLLPILHRLLAGERRRGTRALVVTPTRELAAQIDEHFRQLAQGTRLTSAPIFGGVAMGPQVRAFKTGVDLIVATPGRLLDHLGNAYARLDRVEMLVLDEADRMLDMGFLPDVKRILATLPAKRQTLLYSATMPDPIVALTRELLVDPVAIDIGRKAAPAEGVRHTIFSVARDLKSALFVNLLERHGIERALIFTRTRHRADRLTLFLERAGIAAAPIHGGRSQSQRTVALKGFKHGRIRVLVATDIAARGIDIDELSHVVNFDVPGQPEDYIHRVGRTARAERTGDAFTFVAPDEESDMRAIERQIGGPLPRTRIGGPAETPRPSFAAVRRFRPRGRGGRGQVSGGRG